MAIETYEKDNSSSVVITGRDELHSADVNDIDSTGKKRLCVEIPTSPGTPDSYWKAPPRIEKNATTQNLTTSFQDVFNVTGPGFLDGFKLHFSNTASEFQIIIDGVTIFESDHDFLKDVGYEDWMNSYLSRQFGIPDYAMIEYFPAIPVYFNSSVVIRAREKSFNVTIEQALLFWRTLA